MLNIFLHFYFFQMQIYDLCFVIEQEVKPIPLQNVVVEANSKFDSVIFILLELSN